MNKKILVSACLMGHNVRYNGTEKVHLVEKPFKEWGLQLRYYLNQGFLYFLTPRLMS